MTDHAQLFDDVRRGMIPAHIYNDRRSSDWRRSGCSAGPGCSSRTSRRSRRTATTSSAGCSTIRSSSPAIRGGRGPGDVQHVPAPRHAGVPGGDGQCLELPVPVPRLVLPQRRPHHRPAVPPRRLRRRRGVPEEGPDPAARAEPGQLQRPDLHQHGCRTPTPLEDYLGDFRFYLDFYTRQSAQRAASCADRSAGGSRRTGRSAPRISPATCTTPRRPTPLSSRSVCSESPRPRNARTAPPTGRATAAAPPTSCRRARSRSACATSATPTTWSSRIKEVWTARQQQLVGEDGFMISAATCFPNMSFVHNWPKVEDGDDVLPFISIRMWQPISENETEVLSWFAVDSAAPEEYKKHSYKAYLMCFGSTGHVRAGRRGELGVVDQHGRRLDGTPAAAQQPDGSARGRPASRRGVAARTCSTGRDGPTWVTTSTTSAHLLNRWADHLERPQTPCRGRASAAPANAVTAAGRAGGRQPPGRASAGPYSAQPALGRHAPRPQRAGEAAAVQRRSAPAGASVPGRRGVPARRPALRGVAGHC